MSFAEVSCSINHKKSGVPTFGRMSMMMNPRRVASSGVYRGVTEVGQIGYSGKLGYLR